MKIVAAGGQTACSPRDWESARRQGGAAPFGHEQIGGHHIPEEQLSWNYFPGQ